MALKKLFEPASIGTMNLRNRVIMPAMATNYADKSGLVTSRMVEYYEVRAKSGAGLVVVETANVSPGGRMLPNQLRIDDDKCLPGLSRLAKAINETGARSCVQLCHGGRKAKGQFNNGIKPVAPSSVTAFHYEVPKELNVDEINQIVEDFAESARRTKEAGFSAVELHAAHGYLIHNFLSPLTNKRSDQYGGDLDSRMKFVADIYKRTREKVGKDYPILIRISGDDFTKGGITLEDAEQMAMIMEKLGFDAIDVLYGYAGSSEEGYIAQRVTSGVIPMPFQRGCFVYLGEGIKKFVKVPVIVTGRINEPQLAENILEEGKADFVAIGRGFIADSEFLPKIAEERYTDIRKCVACRVCITAIYAHNPLRCMVNASVGRETEYKIKPAKTKKKVLVVGAGPAGMETARVAALRGHKVMLYDKNYRLGGNLVPAAAVSFKKEMGELLKYFSNQIYNIGVNVQLGTEVDKKLIESINPDVVVLATGAKPILLPIPGIQKKTVTTAIDVLEGKHEVGLYPIVVGGGMVGCETAVFLAQLGRKVTVVEMRSTDYADVNGLAPDLEPFMRKWLLFELWPGLGIRVVGNATAKAVTDDGLVVQDKMSKESLVNGDSIVFAAGLSPNKELAETLKSTRREFYEIGDCVQARHIVDAIDDGAALGYKL